MNKRALKSYIRRDANGVLDIDRSVAEFRKDFYAFLQGMMETEHDYAAAVERVFKKTKVKRIVSNTLITFAMQYIPCEPASWAKHASGISAYIDKAIAEGKLEKKKGRMGGVSRVKKGKKR